MTFQNLLADVVQQLYSRVLVSSKVPLKCQIHWWNKRIWALCEYHRCEHTVWHENFEGVYFCGLAIFSVLQEVIWQLGQIGFSCWELFFAIFRKYPEPSIVNIFVFIESSKRNTYFQFINQHFVVSEWETSCD